MDEREAHEGGRLLGKSRTTDVVDASVVAVAVRYRAVSITGDLADTDRSLAAAGGGVGVISL